MNETTTTIAPPVAAPVAEAMPPLRQEIRKLVLLALPTIGIMMSRLAITFTDFTVVSRLGTAATAAITPSAILVFVVVCLGMGPSMSIQTFVSQAFGRKQPRETGAFAWQGFYIAAVFAMLSLPVSLLIGPVLGLLDITSEVRDMQVAYLRIAFWSMGFAVVCSSLDGFFNGVQKPWVGLIAASTSVVFNLVANIVLVFGYLGFPAMGIRGSAIATVIAWGIRAVMLTTVFLSDRFNRQFRTRAGWRYDRARLGSILSIGWPIALQWWLDIGSWWVFLQFIMGRFGEQTMAASNISMQLMHFSFMPAIGVGISVCSLVGQAIGERRPELAVRRGRIGLSITMAYMGTMALLFLLIPGSLVGLFSADPEVVRLGCAVLLWGAIFQVFDALQITYINALRGAGDTLWPAILVASHCWIVFIAGGLVVARLWPGWGLNGPWMMCTLYIILLGLVLHRRWSRGGWRKIKLFHDGPPRTGFPVLPAEEPVPPPTV